MRGTYEHEFVHELNQFGFMDGNLGGTTSILTFLRKILALFMLRSEKNKDKQTERETMANSKCNLFNSSAKIFQSIKFQFFFP